jgi:F420-non-reducing hydrogenase small subunit
MEKLKLAFYWAASCGGCEIAQLLIGDKLLKVIEAAEILFWPVAMDAKYKDIEAMPDKHIDACLFNGAIRNSEQEHLAKLLRQKSKFLIAYGACACRGGIPGLGNLHDRQSIFNTVYKEAFSNDKSNVFPQPDYQADEGNLEIPSFFDTVRTLHQTVEVDYFIPGCPPEERTTWLALEALLKGELPPRGSIISHSSKAVCDECTRKKNVKKIKRIYRNFEIVPDPEICLLEQGLLCAGIATRGGCGALCPQANMPCTGCYGPVEGVIDQGAHFLSAVASIIDSKNEDEIRSILEGVLDPVGTCYRFSLPDSLVRRAAIR